MDGFLFCLFSLVHIEVVLTVKYWDPWLYVHVAHVMGFAFSYCMYYVTCCRALSHSNFFFLGMQFLLGPVQKETKKLYSFNCISGIPFCKHTSVLEKRMI